MAAVRRPGIRWNPDNANQTMTWADVDAALEALMNLVVWLLDLPTSTMFLTTAQMEQYNEVLRAGEVPAAVQARAAAEWGDDWDAGMGWRVGDGGARS